MLGEKGAGEANSCGILHSFSAHRLSTDTCRDSMRVQRAIWLVSKDSQAASQPNPYISILPNARSYSEAVEEAEAGSQTTCRAAEW
jgi:hypothetical protein